MGNMKLPHLMISLFVIIFFLLGATSAQQCGRQAGGASCANNLCCSQFGYCGNTDQYCGTGCQSHCRGTTPPPPSGGGGGGGGGGGVASIITSPIFEQMLKHRNDANCPAHGFYTYNSFISAAQSFPGFGTTGDDATRKRELAAFFAQTSHETTGGWPTAPDGPYAWGYCFVRENNGNAGDYCSPNNQYPCAPGQKYYGRGPIQISYNYNYGQAGDAIRQNLLNNPDLVATDSTVSFKTAIWFWMTPQGNKPSSHDVITGRWTPSATDRSAGRVPGYGVITNIINGGLECGHGPDPRVQDRVGFFRRYCQILVVSTGDNLDCNNQRPF